MTTVRKPKTCKRCGWQYKGWGCPKCHPRKRKHAGNGSGSTFSRRGGAASVLHTYTFEPLPVYPDAVAVSSGSEGEAQ